MNTREHILEQIKQNKPASGQLPDIPSFAGRYPSLIETFVVQADLAGSTTFLISDHREISDHIDRKFPNAGQIISCIEGFKGSFELSEQMSPRDLQPIDVAVISSSLGVAENGTVWLTEEDCQLRILPFITQHLVVVIAAKNIVENMHHAYQKLKTDETGFGVWAGGPSKTADIEQTLVVGAQGARSLNILIIK